MTRRKATPSKGRSDGLERFGVDDEGKPRWRARLVARHPDTGEKVIDTRAVFSAPGKAEALIEKARLRQEMLDRKLGRVAATRVKFGDAIVAWHDSIERYGSKKSYGTPVRRFRARFGDRWLDTIEPEELQRELSALARKGYSKPYLDLHRTVLLALFWWAADHGYIKRSVNPAKETRVRIPKKATGEVEAPPKRWLTAEEVPRYLEAIAAVDRDVYPLALAQLVLGCRFAEVSALKRSDIDWVTGRVLIKRGQVDGRIGPPKNNKARWAAFPPAALEVLRGHVAEMGARKWPGWDEWLFPRRPDYRQTRHKSHAPLWNLQTVTSAVNRAKEAAGVHTVNSTHLARHTLIGLMEGEAAAGIMERVVGHAHKTTNLRYGEAKVLRFAEEVERVVMRGGRKAGGTAGGTKGGKNRRSGQKNRS